MKELSDDDVEAMIDEFQANQTVREYVGADGRNYMDITTYGKTETLVEAGRDEDGNMQYEEVKRGFA